ncbi:flagellar biosynthetic protein FliO [Pandoraea communis]|uniref:Flagellar protein n=1 Tax=Pandoraea communis TaxID=2508297 RepID=A0A5E4TBF1_9BURK|nr:flagellar biosynthetic protein FliO [Pandoraea communis]MDM8354924.1 flagellar biosynthetic protein FliO [Pandoraea communis]VVD84771.1 flagellar biosynthesis protein FliO [Pandoraea communis]
MMARKVHGKPVRRAVASATTSRTTGTASRPSRVAHAAQVMARAFGAPARRRSAGSFLGLAFLTISSAHAQSPASQAAAVPSLGGAGIVQTGLGLVLVLALLFGLAWLAKRFGLQRPLGGGNVRIVGSAAVGQRERVVVVEVAGDWIVLGVAPGQVRSLHVIDADRVADMPAAPTVAQPGAQASRAAQAFAQKLRESMKKDS